MVWVFRARSTRSPLPPVVQWWHHWRRNSVRVAFGLLSAGALGVCATNSLAQDTAPPPPPLNSINGGRAAEESVVLPPSPAPATALPSPTPAPLLSVPDAFTPAPMTGPPAFLPPLPGRPGPFNRGGFGSAAVTPNVYLPSFIGDGFFGPSLMPSTVLDYAGQQIYLQANVAPDVTGTNVIFHTVTPGLLAAPADVQSIATRTSLNGQANIDTPGTFFLLASNAAVNHDAAVTNGVAGQYAQWVFSTATLATNNGAGITANDRYDLRYTYDLYNQFLVHLPQPGSTFARQKWADNSSPIPRDRVFLNYNYFSNSQFNGTNINQYTPGFEKTIYDGRASIEFRIPLAGTLSNTVTADAPPAFTSNTTNQLGNLTGYYKHLLFGTEKIALSGGVGASVPTADDVHVKLSNGNELLRIRNQAVHVLPFFAGVWSPTERWYNQAAVQVDVDTGGNTVFGTDQNRNFYRLGRLKDATYFYAGYSTGYWLMQSMDAGKRVNGIAPTLELQFNSSLAPQDGFTNNGFAFGSGGGQVQVLNGIVGLNLLHRRDRTMTVAYATPLGGGHDQQYSGQLRLFVNWYFGNGISPGLNRSLW